MKRAMMIASAAVAVSALSGCGGPTTQSAPKGYDPVCIVQKGVVVAPSSACAVLHNKSGKVTNDGHMIVFVKHNSMVVKQGEKLNGGDIRYVSNKGQPNNAAPVPQG